MQNQNNQPPGQDPNTSTPGTSEKNSGESVPQTGENVVNEQEQNKSVNQEEFLQDAAQHTRDANEVNDNDELPSG